MKNSTPLVHYRISNTYSKALLATTLTALFLTIFSPKSQLFYYVTAWKVPKCEVFFGPYFPAFGMDTEIYYVFLRIQSECRKIRTKKTLHLATFHAVHLVITKQYLTKAVLPFGSLSKWLCATSKVAR